MNAFCWGPAVLAGALLITVAAGTGLAGTVIPLNGDWQFRIDPGADGKKAGWAKEPPPGTETVRVPHTWGVGVHEDHEGLAWYFRSFPLPKETLGKHVEIRFGATFYRSRVWLNGRLLGGHEGGHTAYALDATGFAKAENLLAVELDNRPGLATLPGWAMRLRSSDNVWYDWWHYGGIVRDVSVAVHDGPLLRRQRIRTRIEGTTARVSDRLTVENHGAPRKVVAEVVAYAPDGAAVARRRETVVLAAGERPVDLEVGVPSVRLWRLDEPQVYRMEARLLDPDGTVLDSITDNFGARTLEIRDRRLYLNGERVRLSGVTRHEDSPWEGLAETVGTMKADLDDMKALHATLTRPVHYPQHPFILDYCDRNGILLVPEIPMWQFSEEQMKDPAVVALARQMMTEMIEEAGNHPCIFAWSVCNESATFTPGGVAYVRAMKDVVGSLDPERFVTYADDSVANVDDPRSTAAVLADFVMVNQYFGSWAGPAALLPSKLERLGRSLHDKMLVISEFGLAGLFAPDEVSADRMRVQILRDQMAEFARHDFIAGAIFWCYQDYKSHRNLPPGETKGFVEMGLVDEHRQRRPSYAVWKDLTAPARASVEWNDLYKTPTAFAATIARRSESEIPSYALRGYRAQWEVLDADARTVATGSAAVPEAEATEVHGSWSGVTTKSLKLHLRLMRPTGGVALEQDFLWWEPRSGGLTIPAMEKDGKPVPR
jgi:beta-glucuronidase